LYADLLSIRRGERLLKPDEARVSVRHGEAGWITLLRESVDDGSASSLLSVYNCSDRPIDVPIPATAAWTLLLSTDAVEYGGQDRIPKEIVARGDDDSKRTFGGRAPSVSMPPWAAALYRQTRSSDLSAANESHAGILRRTPQHSR
jgi:hypothetical protein